MSAQWVTWIELALSGLAVGLGVALSFRAFKVNKELADIGKKLVAITKDQGALRADVDRHGKQLEGLVAEAQRSRELHGKISREHQSLGQLHADLSKVHSEISDTHLRFGTTAGPARQTRRPELPKGPSG